jgi:hypothetical protein
MLKKLNPDILIGLLLGSLFWVGVFVWQSSQPPNHTGAASQHCEGTKSDCAKATTDERIADYTWWLAVLTAGLVCSGVVQFGFLIRSDNTARMAANAADLSARAAIAIELPVIRINPENFTIGTRRRDDGTQIEYGLIVTLGLANFGRTKAFPIDVQCGWTFDSELPRIPSYTYTKAFPTNAILEVGLNEQGEININDFVFEGDPVFFDAVRNGTSGLWFYCLLRYLDFMDVRHEVGFCWKRYQTVGSGGFTRDANPAYNRKT